MLKRFCLVAVLALPAMQGAVGGYLDENPDEVFAEVYERLGVKLPVRVTRDPYVWLRLEELKREPCDQASITDLALFLEKVGRRREAAEGLYNFVRYCGAPSSALHKSVDMLIKLTDHAKAVEVADEFVRRAPANYDAHYLRAVALKGTGAYRSALVDYANAIELIGTDKRSIGSRVFLGMAEAYAALGRFCEAATPILTWVALDPVNRDNSRSQKLVADYEARGNCRAAGEQIGKERYPLRGQKHVVTVKAEINGVRGVFVLDTGASYVTVKSTFAARAKVSLGDADEITLVTANGLAKGKLAKADKVRLGTLEAGNVPVVVQVTTEATGYGLGIDGLLGMSFLSRFELQMAGGFIEIRTRRSAARQ